MAKLTTNPLGGLADQTAATANINANLDLIEVAMENTLSRDGTAPNAMEADLDLNSNDILNVGTVHASRLVGTVVSGASVVTSVSNLEFVSIAALRAYSTALTFGSARVLAWNSGSNVGGGIFYYDSGDVTSADDGGLIIVDAAGRRWKRQYDGPFSPLWWGARADRTTNDAAAVSSAWTAAKAADAGGYNYAYVDGGGRAYKCSTSVDNTGVSSARQLGMRNMTIITADAGYPGISLIGSEFLTYDHVYVTCDASAIASQASCGWLLGRDSSGGGAGSHCFFDCNAFGDFNIGSWVNLGSETNVWFTPKMNNVSVSTVSAGWVIVGSPEEFDAAGLSRPTCRYQTVYDVAATPLSTAGNTLYHPHIRRNRAYTMEIDALSKANPCVVTVDVAELATAIATYGFANGKILSIDTNGGDFGAVLQGLNHTVANLNAGAGTFELVGRDTSGVVGAYGGGGIASAQTGPAIIAGGCAKLHMYDAYVTVYANNHVLHPLKTDTTGLQDFLLTGRLEPANEDTINFTGASAVAVDYIVKGYDLHIDNSAAVTSVIKTAKTHASSTFKIEGLNVKINRKAQATSSGLFKTPADWTINHGFVMTPTSDISNTMSQFADYQGWWIINNPSGSDKRFTFHGDYEFNDPVTFLTPSAGTTPLVVKSTDATSAAGPFFSIFRDSASPAANDILGRLRWVGKDSGGADQEYGGIDFRILDPTAGSEDSEMHVRIPIAGTTGTVLKLGNYGLTGIQKAATVATDAAFTLTPGTSKVQQFHTGVLTADRAVTLSTSGVVDGDEFTITRTGGGAFNLNVGTGPLKALATNTWGVFRYDGTAGAWKLAMYGAL